MDGKRRKGNPFRGSRSRGNRGRGKVMELNMIAKETE
jgi:hypothetical protein